MTRITQLAMTNNALANLQTSLSKVQQLTEQGSSGKRVAVPSDDPQASASSMVLRSAQAANTQYTRNGQYAQSRLSTADTAMQSITAQLLQVRNQLIRSQSGAMNDAARGAVSEQISQLRVGIIEAYNTQHLGRPIFGGTVAGNAAIDSTGTYIGDGNAVLTKVSSSATVRTDVDGAAIGADTLPGLLDQIAGDILTPGGGGATAQADLAAVDAIMQKLSLATANVGTSANRVTVALSQGASRDVDLTGSITANESIDLAEVITRLAAQQVAYQTAVGVTAKISQVSLLDFLR